ncbi:MAG: peptidoglycan DD-metalloendopeptidase family protein [Micavibrio sp.]
MQNRTGQFVSALKSVDVESLLRMLNRYVPLRHRHVLTRRNTLRLRVFAIPGASLTVLAVLMTGAMMSAPLSTSTDLEIASVTPVILGPATAEPEDAQGQSIFERLALSQKRLKRSMDDAADAERLAMIDPAAGLPTEQTPAKEPEKPAGPKEKTVKIGSGDTLTGVLSRAGLSNTEAYQVVQAVKDHVDPRTLKPGQILNIKLDPVKEPEGRSGYQFASLNMAVDPLRTVSVARGEAESGYEAKLQEREMKKRLYAQEAEIKTSLFGSAAKAGIPSSVVAEAIRVYSWDIDFQRDIRQGDKLEVMYEQFETEDGVKIKTGNVLYARLTLEGIEIPIYRHEMKDGRVDYFQANGKSIRKTLMKTPIDGARVSSGFGMRKHPIQGYHKMHKGMDFAAPSGTPIYAAGDGVIQRANRFSGFGNYVRIRHNSQISTAYAHLSRFAKGMTAGKRVRQGDIIGYVGTTGNSTGPHLHYEVLVNGVQTNPRSVNLPTGEILEGDQLRIFQAKVREIDQDYASHRSLKFAQNKVANKTSVR